MSDDRPRASVAPSSPSHGARLRGDEDAVACALAHPNIALSKYWGKREGAGNYPAVPSLSVTLAGMATWTRVAFRSALSADAFVLNGHAQSGEPFARAVALLDRVRAASGEHRFAEVVSKNDFPTASGLASSASGFAALALAATRAAGLDWDVARVSDLARRSSASAARSLFGGFSELPAGPEAPMGDELLAAVPLAQGEHLPLRVLVCVTSEGAKDVASTDGMRRTAKASPYYAPWLETAPRIHEQLKQALLSRDFDGVGALLEASALAMHASAFAAGVVYVRGATLDVLAAVRALRADGISAYGTMDAGPHVKVFVRPDQAVAAREALQRVPGVLRVLETEPGGGARLVPLAAWEAASGAGPSVRGGVS